MFLIFIQQCQNKIFLQQVLSWWQVSPSKDGKMEQVSIDADKMEKKFPISLIPRPSHHPDFDCLQYAKTGQWEGLGTRLVSHTNKKGENLAQNCFFQSAALNRMSPTLYITLPFVEGLIKGPEQFLHCNFEMKLLRLHNLNGTDQFISLPYTNRNQLCNHSLFVHLHATRLTCMAKTTTLFL